MSKYSDKKKRQAEEAAAAERAEKQEIKHQKTAMWSSVETPAQSIARRAAADADKRKNIAKYNRNRAIARFQRENNDIGNLTNPELITVARAMARQMNGSGMRKAAEIMDALCTRLILNLALNNEVTKALIESSKGE